MGTAIAMLAVGWGVVTVYLCWLVGMSAETPIRIAAGVLVTMGMVLVTTGVRAAGRKSRRVGASAASATSVTLAPPGINTRRADREAGLGHTRAQQDTDKGVAHERKARRSIGPQVPHAVELVAAEDHEAGERRLTATVKRVVAEQRARKRGERQTTREDAISSDEDHAREDLSRRALQQLAELVLKQILKGERFEWLTVRIDDTGDLLLEGQDTAPIIERFRDIDYEYWLTVGKDDKDTVLLHLIRDRFDNATAFREWLAQYHIPCRFHNLG